MSGSAASPGDFDGVANGLLEIPPGATSASIPIGLVEDDATEPEETFTLRILSAENLVLGRATATGIIVDDDTDFPRMSLSIGDASVLEGNLASENVHLRFPVTLSGPTPLEVSVSLLVTSGTASNLRDFSVAPLTVTFPIGATSAFADAAILEDDLLEPDERFTIELDPDSVQVGTGSATGTILNDDAPGVPALGPAGVLVLAAALLAAARSVRSAARR